MDNKIDDIFKKNLSNEMSFSNAEKQWEDVQFMLNQQAKKPKLFWFLTITMTIAICSSLVLYSVKSSTDNQDLIIGELEGQSSKKKVEEKSLAPVPVPALDSDSVSDSVSDSENVAIDAKSLLKNQIVQQNKLLQKNENDFITEPINLEDSVHSKASSYYSRPPNNNINRTSLDYSYGNTLSELQKQYDSNNQNDNIIDNRQEGLSSSDKLDLIDQKESSPYAIQKNSFIKLSKLPQIRFDYLVTERSVPIYAVGPQLHFNSEESNTIVESKGRRTNGIHLGFINDSFFGGSVSDSTSWKPSFGLDVQLTQKLRFYTFYSQQSIHRSTTLSSGYFSFDGLLDQYNPEQIELVNTGEHILKYKNQSLDFILSYQLLDKKHFSLRAFSGLQLNTQTDASAYITNSDIIYGISEYTFDIPDHGFKLTDVQLGLGLDVPIYEHFSMALSWAHFIPFGNNNFKWKNRSRFNAGLTYSFY